MFTGEKLPLLFENEICYIFCKNHFWKFIFSTIMREEKRPPLIFSCKGMIKCVLYRANFSLICEIKLTY